LVYGHPDLAHTDPDPLSAAAHSLERLDNYFRVLTDREQQHVVEGRLDP
jgi:hypothetical protein